MTISVVIPAHNAEGYIGRALESVMRQRRPAEQVIVVDDGSTDGTSVVVSEFGGAVESSWQPNAGASAARNAGILEARGDWIAFLDADDEWRDDHLLLHAELLERNPQLAWSTGNYVRCRCDAGHAQCEDLAPERMAVVREALGEREFFDDYFQAHTSFGAGCCDTMVIRRQALLDAGLFTPGVARMNDMDMWFRLAYRNGAIGFVAEPTAIYHLDVAGSTIKQYDAPGHLVEFMDRHFRLAEEAGCLERFRPSAAKMAGWWVHELLRQGRGRETRMLLRQYAGLFGGYYRWTNWIRSFLPMKGQEGVSEGNTG